MVCQVVLFTSIYIENVDEYNFFPKMSLKAMNTVFTLVANNIVWIIKLFLFPSIFVLLYSVCQFVVYVRGIREVAFFFKLQCH